MHNLELLIEEKEKCKGMEGKDILTKRKIIKAIESLIPQIDDDMKILEKELFFQKKKKSPDVKNKEEIAKLLKNKFNLLKSNSLSPEKEEKINHGEKAENLDDFLLKIENNKKNSQQQERELYEEEDQKIKEWENNKKIQDGMINEISDLVKGMYSDSKMLGRTIDEMSKKTNKTKNKLDNNYDNIHKQTEQINKLNKKIK